MNGGGFSGFPRREGASRRFNIDHRERYRRIHDLGAPFIRAFCDRFDLAGRQIVSIGSGTCAEEVAMAQCGAFVDCIDPITAQLEIGREMAAAAGVANALRFHAGFHQNFQSPERYDAIFVSGAQDWMDTDFRDLIPASYLDFFRRQGAAPSVLAVRFWGNEHAPDVLTTAWFPKALAERFRGASDYRLREYWLSDKHALAIATRDLAELAPDTGFAGCAARFDETSVCKFRWDADSAVTPSAWESLTPPVLAARHRLRRFRGKLRRRRRNSNI